MRVNQRSTLEANPSSQSTRVLEPMIQDVNPATSTGSPMTFLARHILATFITITVPCLFWTVAYFVLLIISTFGGGAAGSPVMYPVGMIVLVVGGAVASVAIFLPATTLAERLVRARGLPGWAQIPISVGVLAVFCLALTALAVAAGFANNFLRTAGTVFLASLVPMGLYWWTTQSGPMVISLLRRMHLIR